MSQYLDAYFWKRVQKQNGEDPCWLWTGAKKAEGYGYLRQSNKQKTVHRLMWESVNEEIPEEMCVLHKCDTPACVNPNHLFLGTRVDNNRDRQVKRRGSRGLRHSIACFGEAHGSAILTNDVAREIRELCAKKIPHRVIAEQFGVHKSLISKVNLRTAWAYV